MFFWKYVKYICFFCHYSSHTVLCCMYICPFARGRFGARTSEPYRVSMHHVPCERSQTMPSGPNAAPVYPSMLQPAAQRVFDFHDYSGWVVAAQLEDDELTTGSFCVDKKPGAASVRDVSHYSRWQLPYQRDAPSCPTSTLTTNLFLGLEQSRLTSSSLKLTLHACAYPAASMASS